MRCGRRSRSPTGTYLKCEKCPSIWSYSHEAQERIQLNANHPIAESMGYIKLEGKKIFLL